MNAVESARQAHEEARAHLARIAAALTTGRQELIEARENAGASLAVPTTTMSEDPDRVLGALTRASARVLALETARHRAEAECASAAQALAAAEAATAYGRHLRDAQRGMELAASALAARTELQDTIGEIATITASVPSGHPAFDDLAASVRRLCAPCDPNELREAGRAMGGPFPPVILRPTVPLGGGE